MKAKAHLLHQGKETIMIRPTVAVEVVAEDLKSADLTKSIWGLYEAPRLPAAAVSLDIKKTIYLNVDPIIIKGHITIVQSTNLLGVMTNEGTPAIDAK